MVFAALLLLSPLPLFGDVVLPVAKPAAIVSSSKSELHFFPGAFREIGCRKIAGGGS